MVILISQIIFVVSVVGILVVILRKVPVILRYPRSPFEDISLIERIKTKVDSSGFFHEFIIHRTEKFLRKMKIVLLRLDNFLARITDRLRQKIRKKKEEEENGQMPM